MPDMQVFGQPAIGRTKRSTWKWASGWYWRPFGIGYREAVRDVWITEPGLTGDHTFKTVIQAQIALPVTWFEVAEEVLKASDL